MQPVKITLTILFAIALLASTGCVFHKDRNDQTHDLAHSAGVDHGEYPGDKEHGTTMQK